MAPLDLGFMRSVKNHTDSLAELIALHTLKPLKTKKPLLAEGLFWSLGCVSTQDG